MSTGRVRGSEPERRHWARCLMIGPDVVPVEAGLSETGGLILNLSVGGAAMQLLGELKPETRHRLRWQISPQESWMEAEGVVAWSGANNTFGVRFVSVPAETLNSISSCFVRRQSPPAESSDERFSEKLALPEELTTLASLAMGLLDADGAVLAVSKGTDFVCISSAGLAPPPAASLEPERLLLAECVLARKVVHCSDLSRTFGHRGEPQHQSCASMIAIPVTCEGNVVAVLECRWKRARVFDNRDIKTLCSISELSPHLPANEAPSTSQLTSPVPIPEEASLKLPEVEDHSRKERPPSAKASSPGTHRSFPVRAAPVAALGLAIAFAAGWYGGSWTSKLAEIVEKQEPATSSAAPQPPTVSTRKSRDLSRSAVNKTLSPHQVPARSVPSRRGPRTESRSIQSSLADTTTPPSMIQLGPFTDNQRALHNIVGANISFPKVAAGAATPASTTPSSSELADANDGPGRISPPVLVRKVQPAYPQAARLTHRSGTVLLDAVVDTEGNVSRVRVVSGDPVLAQAAKEAVLRWRYRPAAIDGRKIQKNVRVTLNFNP